MKYLFALLATVFLAFPAMADNAAEAACAAAHGPKSNSLEYILEQGVKAEVKVLTLTGDELELFNQVYKEKYEREDTGAEGMTTMLLADPASTQFPFVPAIAIGADNCSLFVWRFDKEKIVELLAGVQEKKNGI